MLLKYFNKIVLAAFAVMFICVFAPFALASPPVIDNDNTFELPSTCIITDFEAELEVTDADGDSIEVTSTLGTPVIDSFYVDSGNVSHWQGRIVFDIDQYCGQSYQDSLVITASDDAETATRNYGLVTLEGTITIRIGNSYTLPGVEDWVSVFLDTDDCYCLGGFELTIQYDDSVLTIADIWLETQLADYSNYFNVVSEPYGAGTAQIVYTIEPGSEICGDMLDSPIMYIGFYLDPSIEYPTNFTTTISFYQTEPYSDYNAVTDISGYGLWYPNGCDYGQLDLKQTSGIISCWTEGDQTILGDFNLNGYRYEIGDEVTMRNALMDPRNYLLSAMQLWAGNFDFDTYSLTIHDVLSFYLQESVFYWGDDFSVPYDCQSENDTLLLESANPGFNEQFSLPLYLTTHDTIYNFQACLTYDTSVITIDSVVFDNSIDLGAVLWDGICHITPIDHGLYSLPIESNSIIPGQYYIGNVFGSVNPVIEEPTVTTIEFSQESDYYAYTGCLCNYFVPPQTANSTLRIGYDNYQYLVGDANMFSESWPPEVVGGDVTYLVNYFRGLAQPCVLNNFYAAADVSGDCQVVGGDVTVLVNYFRGISEISFCPDYYASWLSSGDLPSEEPSDWPGCE